MMDVTMLDRERRLLATLAQPQADAAAEDALLVNERGVQRCRDTPPGAALDLQIDGLGTLVVTEQVVLAAYRLLAADGTAAAYCSTVWQHGPTGWVAVLHQRSPGVGEDTR